MYNLLEDQLFLRDTERQVLHLHAADPLSLVHWTGESANDCCGRCLLSIQGSTHRFLGDFLREFLFPLAPLWSEHRLSAVELSALPPQGHWLCGEGARPRLLLVATYWSPAHSVPTLQDPVPSGE